MRFINLFFIYIPLFIIIEMRFINRNEVYKPHPHFEIMQLQGCSKHTQHTQRTKC